LYLGLFVRVLLGLLILALLPLLVVFAFLPVLRWITLGVLASVGDSFIAVVSPDSLDSMVRQINRDMDWSLARSPQLVVLAHSQGAMLVREALARQPRGDRVVLVGLGSGLGPLHSLRRAHGDRVGMLGWVVLVSVTLGVVFTLCSVALFCVGFFISGWTTLAWIAFALALVVIYLAQLGLRRMGFPRLVEQWHRDLRLPEGATRRWIEYSSQFDPVSCGSILSGCPDEPVHEVVNTSVLPREHAAYRCNWFILSRVVQEMAILAHPPVRVAAPGTARHRQMEDLRRMSRNRRALRAQIVVGWLALGVAAAYVVNLLVVAWQ
ncbi:MAG: hypothetical protein ACXVH3_23795, partial [Solirubrobacteraceae bacterium]